MDIDEISKCCPARRRVRRNVSSHEHPVYQPCPPRPARHSHEYISHGLGCGHWHWGDSERRDSTPLHLLYGLSDRLGDMPFLAYNIHKGGDATL